MSLPIEILEPDSDDYPNIIRTLLLDDNSFDRARIKRMSAKTNLMIDLTEVSGINELKTAVRDHEFDLILIDYRLPEGDGLDVLDFIQKSRLNHEAATIMITGDGGLETAVTAMRNGCHDFLTKDTMTTDQLRAAMVGAMRTAQQSRDLAAQTAHQREVIRQGLASALMDKEVQATVVSLFKDQFPPNAFAIPRGSFADQDHSDLEALLATLDQDDDFIFN